MAGTSPSPRLERIVAILIGRQHSASSGTDANYGGWCGTHQLPSSLGCVKGSRIHLPAELLLSASHTTLTVPGMVLVSRLPPSR